MSHYRLYILDHSGRHIEDVAEVIAANDDDAICRARSINRRGSSELWLRDRLIETFAGRAQA